MNLRVFKMVGISRTAEELLASQKYTGTESWFVCCLFVDLFVSWLVGSFFVGGSFVGLMVVSWLVVA